MKKGPSHIVPSTANAAVGRAFTTMGMLALAAYTMQFIDTPIAQSLAGLLVGILALMVAVYWLIAGVLTIREKRQDIRDGNEVEHVVKLGSYQSINYNALAISRRLVPSYTLPVIGLSLLGLGILMASLLSTSQVQQVHDGATLKSFMVITILVFVTAIVLCIIGLRNIRDNEKHDYDKFVADNKFRLIKYPDTKGQVEYYEHVLRYALPMKISRINYELSGEYRGQTFRACAMYSRVVSILPHYRYRYYGTFIYPYHGTASVDQLTKILRPYNSVMSKATVVDGNLIIQMLGLPQDRVGMMRLFQTVDIVIDT